MREDAREGIRTGERQGACAGLFKVSGARDNTREGQAARGDIQDGVARDGHAAVSTEVDCAGGAEGGAAEREGVGREGRRDVTEVIGGGDVNAALIEDRLTGKGIGGGEREGTVAELGQVTRATEDGRNRAGLQSEGATSQGGGAADGAGLHGHGANGFVVRNVERAAINRQGGRIGEDAGSTEGQGTRVKVGRTGEGVRTGEDEFTRAGLREGQRRGTIG